MRQAAEAAKAALEAAKKPIASAGEGGMDTPAGWLVPLPRARRCW